MFAGSFRAVWRKLRSMHFDLIDAHHVYPDGFAAILLGTLFDKPVVVSARGSDINHYPQFATIRPMVKYVLRRADALIAVSQSLKDAMVELGCNSDKVTVIGNGVDPQKFNPQPRAAARRLLGLPENDPIVLSVGGLVELKGFHVLIDAMARLRPRRPNVRLFIVGEGEYREQLMRQINGLDLAENVMLVGAFSHDQLRAWYSAADVFCLASSSEGCPNVVLEAMACGQPVVATKIRGTQELIVSRQFGTLVARDSAEFERAVDDALTRQWDREAIVAYARSHGWEQVAIDVLSVYSGALASFQRNRTRKAAA